jgi:beta-glucanase (GH16 family)
MTKNKKIKTGIVNTYLSVMNVFVKKKKLITPGKYKFKEKFDSHEGFWQRWNNGWFVGGSGGSDDRNKYSYDAKNIHPAAGKARLDLMAVYPEGTDPFAMTYPFSGVMFYSKEKFKYGRFRVTVKIDDIEQTTFAAWLKDPVKDVNETDIFELFNTRKKIKAEFTNHWGTNYGDDHYKSTGSRKSKLTKQLTTIELDWKPDRLTWFLDGVPVKILYSNIPQVEMIFIINFGTFQHAADGSKKLPPHGTYHAHLHEISVF